MATGDDGRDRRPADVPAALRAARPSAGSTKRSRFREVDVEFDEITCAPPDEVPDGRLAHYCALMAIDFKLLLSHLRGGGVVEVFLRGHLWVEKHLRDLVSVELADPSAVNLDRMAFSQKVNLAQALGVITAQEAEPLRRLNKIRNRMAHDLTGEPTEDDLASLENSLKGRHERLRVALAEHLDPKNDITKRFEYVIISLLQQLEWETLQRAYKREHEGALSIFYMLCALDEDMGKVPDEEEHRIKQNLPQFPLVSDTLLPPYGTGTVDRTRGT